MKQIKHIIGIFILTVFFCVFSPTTTEAADSYTDPKTFYNTCSYYAYHAEFSDEYLYYCMKAKTSAPTSQLRFYTIGFQITASGNGSSMSIDVKRGGSYFKEVKETSYSDGYTYTLYRIKYDDICEMMRKKDTSIWTLIADANTVTLKMDAIMTTKQAGSNTPDSTITSESSKGEVRFSNNGKVWYVNDSNDFDELNGMFGRERLTYYRNIKQPLNNYTLTLKFYAKCADYTYMHWNNNPVTSTKGYRFDETKSIQILNPNGSIYQKEMKRFQTINLDNPDSGLGIRKTGYKIISPKEWLNNASTRSLDAEQANITSSELTSLITKQDITTAWYINWKEITYVLKYMPNEKGSGTSLPQSLLYETTYFAGQNMFYSETHDFIGWNTKADGTGTWYYENDAMKNLSDTEGDVVYLYAQWQPKVYEIIIDLGDATGGTDKFYEVYGSKFTLKKDSTTGISKITPPSGSKLPKGYHFTGCYASKTNNNQKIIDANGNILIPNNYYTNYKTIYAKYEPNEYTIYLDNKGGEGGATKTTVLYDSYASSNLEAPAKKGYSFKGYYTEPNGQGECYFNEFMAPLCVYKQTKNITLYAYWVDDVNPEGKLYIPDDWSNNERGIEISGYARDYGSGLQKVDLYLEQSGEDILVKSYKNLNGKKILDLSDILHTTEGVFVYRMEMWDNDMNLTEETITVYKPAKYDVSEPTGYADEDSFLNNLIDILMKVYVTDYVTGN